MKKIIFTVLLLLPAVAHADDLSDCTPIGYRHYWEMTVESCSTPPEICKEDPSSDLCKKNIKTPEQCEQEIAEMTERLKETDLVYRCPATPERVAKMSGKPDAHLKYFYNNGTEIDNDTLRADTENVYIFRQTGFFGRDSILVLPDKDGLDLLHYQSNR